jgi:PncC family amidohydrolase
MQDLLPRAERIAELLKAAHATVAVAESSAGGLISAALLSVPGASAYFFGGAVVYTSQARSLLMDIPEADMVGIRSSSEPYATLLANRVQTRFGATWGLSETGATGPSGNRYGDAAGHGCFAVAGPRTAIRTLETASTDRVANMRVFATTALDLLEAALRG